MKQYFAPMEGITTYVFRCLHHKYFKGVDCYFTPFISPTMHGTFTPRERKDILPAHTQGVPTVPQILANNAEYFLETTKELEAYGYTEVNLNLGCPSTGVVNKAKGSGLLGDPFRLEKFLDEIFEKSILPISIKTRIGRFEEEEWEELLALYNRYPLKELIVHPRVQKDFYKQPVHKDLFVRTWKESQCPVCYNGDIYTVEDYRKIESQCLGLSGIMLGRGLLVRPDLLEQVSDGAKETQKEPRFWKFVEELFEAYYEELGNNALYKMKELWIYMEQGFDSVDKYTKKIKKAKNILEYRQAVEVLKEITLDRG